MAAWRAAARSSSDCAALTETSPLMPASTRKTRPRWRARPARKLLFMAWDATKEPSARKAGRKQARVAAGAPEMLQTKSAMPLSIGQIIDDKYRITRLIGEGGMGAVFEGENLRIRRRVAIKVLHAETAANA